MLLGLGTTEGPGSVPADTEVIMPMPKRPKKSKTKMPSIHLKL